MAEMTYRDALRTALIEEMDRDDNVFCIGEDICRYPGTPRVTEGQFERYGRRRRLHQPST